MVVCLLPVSLLGPGASCGHSTANATNGHSQATTVFLKTDYAFTSVCAGFAWATPSGWCDTCYLRPGATPRPAAYFTLIPSPFRAAQQGEHGGSWLLYTQPASLGGQGLGGSCISLGKSGVMCVPLPPWENACQEPQPSRVRGKVRTVQLTVGTGWDAWCMYSVSKQSQRLFYKRSIHIKE